METKETEEQTSKRVCDLISEKHYNNSYRNLTAQDKWILTFEIAKRYHQERLKQEVPSDEEIKEKNYEVNKNCSQKAGQFREIGFELGAKYIIEVLTKGQ